MKTPFLLFSLLLLTAWTRAQNSDEAAIRKVTEGETMASMVGDVAKELSYWRNAPYISLSGTGGSNKPLFVQGYENVKRQLEEWGKMPIANTMGKPQLLYSDYQVRVSGSSAWATYRQKVTFPNGQGHTNRESRYLEKVENDWKIVNVTFMTEELNYPGSGDEASIKEVIEGETKAFGNRMADKVMSYWAHTPYISHSMEVMGYESLSDAMLKVVADNPSIAEYQSAANSDYAIRVNGTSAWVTFMQERQTAAGKARARQARYLEKLNGQWKLVAVLTDDEVPPMTEALVKSMTREYEQGPSAYFKKYCTPDYVFVGSEGDTYTLDQTLDLLKKVGGEKVSMQVTDLKIRHYGKTAIVTGINTSSYQIPGKAANTYKDRFTYTYLYDGSQWKWTSAQHGKLDYSTSILSERK